MESQKCPQQAAGVLSVVKAGQISQSLTSLPSSFSWRGSEQTGSLSKIYSGHSNCCLKEVKFQLTVIQFNSVELLSSSWVAFYLWNNLLSLIHLSCNLTTTTHHEKIKLNRLIHHKHALWGALADWGGIDSNMLWHCATLTGQSYSSPSIQARLVIFSRLSSKKRSLCPEMQSWHSAQSTHGHFQGPMNICCTSQTLH